MLVRTAFHTTWIALILVALNATPTLAQKTEVFGPEPLGAATGVPKIEVDEARWDWGEIYQGEMIRHTFVIRNVGTAPLLINKVKPG